MPVVDHQTRKSIAVTIALTAVATAILAYLALAPEGAPLLTCPFKALTGLDCPGCGTQRAVRHLLHNQPLQAWRANPFMLIAAPLAATYILIEVWRHRLPRLYRAISRPWVIIATLAAIIIWWLSRLLLPNC